MTTNLSNKTYDVLKHITQVVLPALGSLYFGLSQIWDFPAGEEVVGSLALLTTFGGVVLTKSSKAYKADEEALAGDFVVDTKPDGKRIVQLQLSKDPEEIIGQDRIIFNVVDTTKDFYSPRAE